MARILTGSTIPVVRVRGSSTEIGATIGRAMRPQIQRSVRDALARLWSEQQLDEAGLAERMAPAIAAAERCAPEFAAELRARATAADVPFAALAYLSADGLPPRSDGQRGCTSLAVRGPAGGLVLGHTEDALVPDPEQLFVLDATIAGSIGFVALCYVHALPGCSAAVNGRGLGLLLDWLPDPDAQVGLTMDFVARALLALPSIDAALDFLASTPRSGGANCLLAQGDRIVNVELTSRRMAAVEAPRAARSVHTNHFLDAVLARAAGRPAPDSVVRWARAWALSAPLLDLEGMKRLLSDRVGYPDSICRERTIGAFVADLAHREVEVCWGEPDAGTWARFQPDPEAASASTALTAASDTTA